MYDIARGQDLTLARHCFGPGGIGAAAGTRVRVLDIAQPAPEAPDQTVVLVVQTLHNGTPSPFCLRVPLLETMEARLNLAEAQAASMQADIEVYLQAIDGLPDNDVKSELTAVLLTRLSPAGRDFVQTRPDKAVKKVDA